MSNSVPPYVHVLIIAVALGSMLLLGVGFGRVSLWFTPHSSAPAIIDQTQYVKVISASYGLNCSEQSDIDAAMNNTRTSSATKKNNVLEKMGALCNKNPRCQIAAKKEEMGIPPTPGCDMNLSVDYRCFSYDRLHTLTVPAGSLLKIDCTLETP